MARTLYAKLALVLTALVAVLLVAHIAVTMRATRTAQEESTQILYRDVAANLLQSELDPSWNLPVLRSEFGVLMRLNPAVELYLTDSEGRLRAWSAPEGRVLLERIDLEPVRAFLAGEPLPIVGDDPRHPGRRRIFSAARVGDPAGYLYVILEGEQYRSVAELVRGSENTRVAVLSLALVSAFGLVVGLVLFRAIMGVSQQVDALEELDRLRRELVIGVFHDLRTPLSALSGYIDTLTMMEGELEPTDRRRYLTAAARHAERLTLLVDDLFDLAKLESGVVQPRIEPFHVGELVQDVVQKFALRAESSGVRLRAGPGEGLPMANGDIALVERALENLLDNALRHTPRGGEVAVRALAGADRVEISVADSGPGIPAEALPRVFERFYRHPRERGEGGMGLGLAMVKRIVELHGGDVSATNDPGRGACVRMAIPTREGARSP